MSVARLISGSALVTIMPVATLTINAGIWDTKPSPIVSRVNNCADSGADNCNCSIPIINPAAILMKAIIIDAIASPLTNLLPPSMVA